MTKYGWWYLFVGEIEDENTNQSSDEEYDIVGE